MEQDIMLIIEADLEAQKLIKEAEDKMQEGLIKTKSEKSIIEENVWNTAKSFIENERKRLETELENATKENMHKYDKDLQDLEISFKNKKNEWVNELFNNIINEK